MKFAFRVDTRKQIGVEVNLTPKGKVAPVTFATRHCIYQSDFFSPHIFFLIFFMLLTLFSEVEHALSTPGGWWRHAATSKSV